MYHRCHPEFDHSVMTYGLLSFIPTFTSLRVSLLKPCRHHYVRCFLLSSGFLLTYREYDHVKFVDYNLKVLHLRHVCDSWINPVFRPHCVICLRIKFYIPRSSGSLPLSDWHVWKPQSEGAKYIILFLLFPSCPVSSHAACYSLIFSSRLLIARAIRW
jgi:hypothetical protein